MCAVGITSMKKAFSDSIAAYLNSVYSCCCCCCCCLTSDSKCVSFAATNVGLRCIIPLIQVQSFYACIILHYFLLHFFTFFILKKWGIFFAPSKNKLCEKKSWNDTDPSLPFNFCTLYVVGTYMYRLQHQKSYSKHVGDRRAESPWLWVM